MTGGLFLCCIASCPLLPCHSSYLPPSSAAFPLMLPPFLRCHCSDAALFLRCYSSDPVTLLTLPSLLRCTLLTMLSFWCPLIISTAELPFFVGSVYLTSVACSSGSPDKSDHRQTWNVDKNWSPTNSVGRKIYLLWNSQTPPTLFRKHSERGWPLLWNNFASQTPATPSRGLSKAYRRLLWITRRQNFFCQRGKWIALSMDLVTTILPIKFKFWLRSQ